MILGMVSTRHEIGGHQWQLFKWKTIGENLGPYTRKDVRKLKHKQHQISVIGSLGQNFPALHFLQKQPSSSSIFSQKNMWVLSKP